MNTLTATKRSKADKLKTIRNNGMIPAVVYGVRVENTMLSVPAINFEKVLKTAGETSTILLEINNDNDKEKSKKIDVLIHDIQVDPIKGFPVHIDFLAIDMNKKIKVEIPIEFIGIAPAEKDGIGNLVKTLFELEIEALPKDLPHNIQVDLSTLLALEDQIRVENIVSPIGVKILTDKEEVVALIAAIKEEKEEEEAPVDLSSIEVEKKGKKDEESGEETPEQKQE